MDKILDLMGDSFETEVLKSPIPVLVDFWAPWCMPCRMMAPLLGELAEELKNKIKIVKVDTENPANQELAVKYQIQSIPNLKLFKNGQAVAEFIGLRNKESLLSDLEKYL